MKNSKFQFDIENAYFCFAIGNDLKKDKLFNKISIIIFKLDLGIKLNDKDIELLRYIKVSEDLIYEYSNYSKINKKTNKYKTNQKTKRMRLLCCALFTSIFLNDYFLFRIAGKLQEVANQKYVNEYYDIVENFADFLEANGCDTPKEICDNFTYALHKGYLSGEHEFAYSFDHEYLYTNHGIICIQGKAVCLNIADMLKDIYRAMGYEAYGIDCYCKARTEEDKTTKETIKNGNGRNLLIDELKELKDDLNNEGWWGNHYIVYVYDKDGKVYFFDPTNYLYLSKDSTRKVKIVNSGYGKYYDDMTLKYFSSVYNCCELKTLKVMFQDSEVDENLEVNILPNMTFQEFHLRNRDKIYDVAENRMGNNETYYNIAEGLVGANMGMLFILELNKTNKKNVFNASLIKSDISREKGKVKVKKIESKNN